MVASAEVSSKERRLRLRVRDSVESARGRYALDRVKTRNVDVERLLDTARKAAGGHPPTGTAC